jgi:predicted nucleic acid-binding protein
MKGRIVSNTGPIIALAAIGKLEIIHEIFEEVMEKQEPRIDTANIIKNAIPRPFNR